MAEHKSQIEECKSIFPTWTWLVGIISGAVLLVASGTYIYATQETTQENKLSNLDNRISKVEIIQKDLDTVKTLLRSSTKEK